MPLSDITLDNLINKSSEIAVEYAPKLVGAILIWIIGSWVVKRLIKVFYKAMENREMDASLKPFLKGIISMLLKVMLIISVLSTLGIKMTSFIAILGAAGLAIGMALSGTLQNFAGGVVLLLFKPFKVGDFIEAKGHKGTVSEIQIFNTILKTTDNKTVIIPNGGLSNSEMVNYSTEPTRRVDMSFGIAYGDDANLAFDTLKKMITEDPRVLQEPAHFVAINGLGNSSVDIVARAWVKKEDYWGLFHDMQKAVYEVFPKENLNIPFPQMDVHLHKVED